MGFTEVLAIMQRVLPKRRQQNTFEALEADEDDDESWRGSMATSTEDWNRIQEGQRMLQLSTSLWYGSQTLQIVHMAGLYALSVLVS